MVIPFMSNTGSGSDISKRIFLGKHHLLRQMMIYHIVNSLHLQRFQEKKTLELGCRSSALPCEPSPKNIPELEIFELSNPKMCVQLCNHTKSLPQTCFPSSLARVTSEKSPLAPRYLPIEMIMVMIIVTVMTIMVMATTMTMMSRYLKAAAAVSSNLFQHKLILSPAILLLSQLDND